MSSKRASVSNKPLRLPRKGFFFTLVRFAGLLLKVAGSLLLGIAVIGFFFMLVRISPSLVESIRYIDQQKMAGFIFFTLLGYLLFFPILGLTGLVMAGIGFVLGHVGTEAIVSKSLIELDQVQMSQLNEPPTKGAV
ncbi:MAG TPA: hypothetical protein VLT51_14715 [Anaerolineales bacterium]|nr:hypothetical protein [Anaerolineales bacterium]